MQIAIEKLSEDPVMAGIIARVGDFGMVYREPHFESLVRSIVSQQISTKVARVFMERLVARMPDGIITPEAILRMRATTLRKMGFSGAKTEYIRDLARPIRFKGIFLSMNPSLLDDEEVIARLTQVKGIGVWTAHMFLIFALRRPDVLPTGDLVSAWPFGKRMGWRAFPLRRRCTRSPRTGAPGAPSHAGIFGGASMEPQKSELCPSANRRLAARSPARTRHLEGR